MPVKCQTIVEAMDRLAPRYLAESWDNVGLLVGSYQQEISSILVALDFTPAVLAQAVKEKANLIITHHPFIFNAFKSVRTDQPQGKLLADLLKADIALFAAHTNLDNAKDGLNELLSNLLGLDSAKPLLPDAGDRLFKLVVFVPETHLDAVRQAITAAGAGKAGNYSDCTFQMAGTGTFLPLMGSKPFIGTQGNMEFVTEYRLEAILPERISKEVVTAMHKAHPYEEVAYDLYRLENFISTAGLGRVGNLAKPVTLSELAQVVKKALKLEHLRLTGDEKKMIKVVALCGGAGASLIRQAKEAGADVLITGDVKYHDAQEACERGLALIDAGHFATEWPVVEAVADYLHKCAELENWSVTIKTDTQSKDVIRIV